jgi:hypothetical protein
VEFGAAGKRASEAGRALPSIPLDDPAPPHPLSAGATGDRIDGDRRAGRAADGGGADDRLCRSNRSLARDMRAPNRFPATTSNANCRRGRMAASTRTTRRPVGAAARLGHGELPDFM